MPTTVNNKQDTERALSTHKQLATKDANAAAALVITTDAEYEKASDVLVTIKGHIRDVTTQKKKITDPMNLALKETRALFKPIEDKLGGAKDTLTKAMLEFREKQRQEAAAKEAELQAAVESGDMDVDQALDQMPAATQEKTTFGKKGATTVRTVKDVRVNWTTIDSAYVREIMERPAVQEAMMREIRKDALGNAAQGVESRVEAGVEVFERESL